MQGPALSPNAVRSALRCGTGNRPQPVPHRRAQLVQPGEGQLHFRLHAEHPHHPAPGRPLGQVVEQRGLAHPWIAADHQGPAVPGPDGVEDRVQHTAFAVPVSQRERVAQAARTG